MSEMDHDPDEPTPDDYEEGKDTEEDERVVPPSEEGENGEA